MKKDSFTFSDKLKKSKTLPLSKRIPSRVGGEVKAKRTLFERAQRDLPFIIVAALALLLLPFLSRESGDIDTPSVVWGDGDTYVEDFNSKPKSAEGEIALSSFRNPLDLIIRHGQQDSSARDAVDSAYSDGESSSSGSEGYSSSSRSSYGSEEYSSSPATSRYGKTVKRSVRNSINRVPTSIGSLSRGSMVSTSGGGAPTHSLSFGSRAKDAAPKVQGPGVRPVALQPLTAAGKGRDLTGGDALYAEAARSIGAMNRPGAKQALMDAQLADVDGKPLGETKGGSGPGEGAKPGAGGNMANNWNHTPLKPWWWDMMKDRSQRRWELWHYNWEKMASDSLIALTRGFASCLITGSNDFKVDKFFGTDGSKNWKCFDSNGKVVEGTGSINSWKQSQTNKTTTKDGGTEETVNQDVMENYRRYCISRGGHHIQETESSRKSAFETRLNCLGIGLDDIKDKYETRRAAVCDGLTGTPRTINITAQRNGKDRYGRLKSTGLYVVSNKTFNSNVRKDACKQNEDGTFTCQCISYVARAKYGENIIPEDVADDMSKVVVFRIGTFNLTDDDIYLSSGQRIDLDSAYKANSQNKKAARRNEREAIYSTPEIDAEIARLQAQKKDLVKKEMSSATAKEDLSLERQIFDVNQKIANAEKRRADQIEENRKTVKSQKASGDYSEIEINDIVDLADYNIDGNKRYDGCYTEDDLKETLKPVGKWRTKANARKWFNEIQSCDASAYRRWTSAIFKPVEMAKEESQVGVNNAASAKVPTVDCIDSTVFIPNAPEKHLFKATIQNPGKHTIAFVLEYVEKLAYDGAYFDNSDEEENKKGSSISARTGYRIIKRIDYFLPSTDIRNGWSDKIQDNGDGSYTFYGDVEIGESTTVMDDRPGRGPNQRATPGTGTIVWVTTDDTSMEKGKPELAIVKEDSSRAVFPNLLGRDATCKYRWGCGSGYICGNDEASSGGYCFEWIDNNDHEKGKKFFVSTTFLGYPVKAEPLQEVNAKDVPEDTNYLSQCEPICIFKANGIPEKVAIKAHPDMFKYIIEAPEVHIPDNCDDCNKNPKVNIIPQEKCYIDDNSGRKFYNSVPVEGDDGVIYHFITSKQTVAGPASFECTPICADKAKALGIFQTKGVGSPIPLNTKQLTTADKVMEQGIDVPGEVCPYCSEVCKDPITQEPCPCLKVENNVTPNIHPLYVRSSTIVLPREQRMHDATPICYKKAIALGNIYVRNTDGTAGEKVDPDDEIVDMLLGLPRSEREALCPYCSDDEGTPQEPKCDFDFNDTFKFNMSDEPSNPSSFNTKIAQTIDDLNDCIRRTRVSLIDIQGHTDASTRNKTEASKSIIQEMEGEEKCVQEDGTLISDLLIPEYRLDSCYHCSSVENLGLGLKRAQFITKKILEGHNGKDGIAKSNPDIRFVMNVQTDSQTSGQRTFGNAISMQSVYNPSGSQTITFRLTGYGSHCVGVSAECIRSNKCSLQSNDSKENMTKDRKVMLLATEYNR